MSPMTGFKALHLLSAAVFMVALSGCAADQTQREGVYYGQTSAPHGSSSAARPTRLAVPPASPSGGGGGGGGEVLPVKVTVIVCAVLPGTFT